MKKNYLTYLLHSLLFASTLTLAGCGDSSDTPTPVDEEVVIDDGDDSSDGGDDSSGDGSSDDGDDSSDDGEIPNTLTSAFNLTDISSANTSNADGSGKIHQMSLTWDSAAATSGATGITYTACITDESKDNSCASLGEVTDKLTMTVELDSLLSALSQEYFILADNGSETLSSSESTLSSESLTEMIGYFKASNTGEEDQFGHQVAMSDDGKTIVVGAPLERSNATGINGDETNNSISNAGAVYVFKYANGSWNQAAYLKASNSNQNDLFGVSLDISNDGLTIAVAASGEQSNSVGIGGDENDNSADDSGAVYLFTSDGTSWTQSAYIKASNAEEDDGFGEFSVALNADGSTLAVGTPSEGSNATGINGDESDNSALNAGAVYVFEKDNSIWSQTAYLKASNVEADDEFGSSVALSGDGNTLIVGAEEEDSGDTSESDNSAADAGAAYIFNNNSGWSQTAYIKASNPSSGDIFGNAVSINDDGTLVAIGAYKAQTVSLFTFDGSSWAQSATVIDDNKEIAGFGDYFSFQAVKLSGDGKVLAVGAATEGSSALGLNGDGDDNSADSSGAVYLYTYEDDVWSQKYYIKASNTEYSDGFGSNVALNKDGSQIVIGAGSEASSATGVNGDQTNNDVTRAGAVYIY